jgi:hypothetical protein
MDKIVDDEAILRRIIQRNSAQEAALKANIDALMDDLHALQEKTSIAEKALKMIEAERKENVNLPEMAGITVTEPTTFSEDTGGEVQGGMKTGMTAIALDILSSEGRYLTLNEIIEALYKRGFAVKRVNAHIMLQRQMARGTIRSRMLDGIRRYKFHAQEGGHPIEDRKNSGE